MKIRKNILKEASVLLIASLMILSSIVVTAKTIDKGKTINEGNRTVILWEGFEAGVMPPTDWTLDDPSNGWSISTSAFSGSYSAKFYSTSYAGYLISPTMDLSGMTKIYLSFWHKEEYWPIYGEYSPDDGGHWYGFGAFNKTEYTHEQIDISFLPYSTVKLRFLVYENRIAYIDEIRISDEYANEFMGLEIAPLGHADLTIEEGALSISNCISGQNEIDGVSIKIDACNTWDFCMANPDPDNSIPVGAECRVIAKGVIDGVPDLLLNSISRVKTDDYKWCGSTNMGAGDYTIEAFLENDLVYYQEKYTTTDGKVVVVTDPVNPPGWDFHWGVGEIDNTGFLYIAGIWTWGGMETASIYGGPQNIGVDRVEIIPEAIEHTQMELTQVNIYLKDITESTATEIYAIFNDPPSVPTIDGSTSGKILTPYDYNLTAIDPESGDVYYFVDWGDADISLVGPYASGVEITVSHIWLKKGTYIIRTKAMDSNYAESDWTKLRVTMPKNKPFVFNFPFLSWLFERFPNAFPILRYVIGV